MGSNMEPVVILVAEDDDDDIMLIKRGFKEARLLNTIYCVKDGEELMDYLNRSGQYRDQNKSPRPGLILLDLNMPNKDGRKALEEIKSDDRLKSIPVIILTTSKAEEDILRSYDIGANAFVMKPVGLEDFMSAVKLIGEYWLQLVELPFKEDY
jgi:CheY-like chemotaxis protein